MASTTSEHPARQSDVFRHEALLYADDAGFLEGTVPFIEEGVAAGEALLVALPQARLDLLGRHVDLDGGPIVSIDMEEVGRNPARIIPVWSEFVESHSRPGGEVRGIGEPIWPGRSEQEIVECVRHEALLNLAFADRVGFQLLCPYDTTGLDPAVVDHAARTHAHLVTGEGATASAVFEQEIAPALAIPLPPVPPSVEEVQFSRADIGAVRRFVAARATAAGVDGARLDDLVLAVSEVATNSVCHGGGSGTILVWHDGRAVYCEVRDRGRIDDPLAGRVRPGPHQIDGRGLWLINQLCDLVQIRVTDAGQVVRLHVHRA